ncbi:hypothetical protein J2Y45_005015 [Dyadobacter sp. BE34]|jgi:hypothetical protein|uniref:Uncharacterized protein n=1 Tax=Dyadobacter fermentans TaxID=94254 RepID=A0ABU1R4C4_9BACT|nr:hypothetical protein [Dyadobacter fermentans]MDR7045556.1 hypothetical protein [Dyadobacter sp. BE242]MDR7199869.1 hypothetical protein [Dyadobacter sp. BE34]MDR7217672.1 hypothetical protein [Dyadobacter sp. BE31]MDR7265760.1 hypothetical protein [Dyadobacter sp. BE32]
MQAKIMQENNNHGIGTPTFGALLILVNDYYI